MITERNVNDIIIRDARQSDAMAIGRLYIGIDEENFVGAFGTAEAMGHYMEATFGKTPLFTPDVMRVAEVDGEVVGICITYPQSYADMELPFVSASESGVTRLSDSFDEAMSFQMDDIRGTTRDGHAYLDSLCVDTEHRHMGIGTMLVADALSRNGNTMLYCRQDNEAASSLYRKMGFRVMGIGFGISEDLDEMGPAMLIMLANGQSAGDGAPASI